MFSTKKKLFQILHHKSVESKRTENYIPWEYFLNVILMSDKLDFRAYITRDKEGH